MYLVLHSSSFFYKGEIIKRSPIKGIIGAIDDDWFTVVKELPEGRILRDNGTSDKRFPFGQWLRKTKLISNNIVGGKII